MSGPARRKLIKCERAPDVFFFKKKKFACATDKFVTCLRKIRGQSCRGQRARQREREERRKNLHNKSLVSANNGEENEESRYVN